MWCSGGEPAAVAMGCSGPQAPFPQALFQAVVGWGLPVARPLGGQPQLSLRWIAAGLLLAALRTRSGAAGAAALQPVAS